MKSYIRVSIALLMMFCFFQNCKITNKTASTEATHLETNTLIAYGEEIYKRENCKKCHTQQIDKANLKLISLDGVGGKYSNSWLYYYLLDPQSLIPESAKSPYFKLFDKTFSKDVLSKIANEHGLKKSNKKLLNNLIQEAQSLSDNLNSQEISINNDVEILALIAFIQQIPSSKTKQKLDSLEHIEYLEKQKIWDNPDTIAMMIEVANNEGNKEKGKFIFQSYCSPCHGMEGQGIVGPNLTDDYWLHGHKKSEIAKTIAYGLPAKGMIAWKSQLTPRQVGEIISFIASIRGTNPQNAKEPQGTKE